MNTGPRIRETRERVRQLAAEAEPRLATHYALWHPPGQRRTLYRRFRKALGRLLRLLHLRPPHVPEPWVTTLKDTAQSGTSNTLLVWALGVDSSVMRTACEELSRRLSQSSEWAPVLVTDVPDFAFYSRLGWLVEYVPKLSEPAGHYYDRKQRYLAWRYRDAPVLPVTAGLVSDVSLEDLLSG